MAKYFFPQQVFKPERSEHMKANKNNSNLNKLSAALFARGFSANCSGSVPQKSRPNMFVINGGCF